MNLDEAWTVEIGGPVKLLNGHFGKVIKVNLQQQVIEVQEYHEDYSVGVRQIDYRGLKTLTRNPLYESKRQALLEV